MYVCFFPQIVTGPIVRHGFLMPQIRNQISKNFDINYLNVGITTFAVGLFKKVVLADNLALYVNPFFSSVESNPNSSNISSTLILSPNFSLISSICVINAPGLSALLSRLVI